jgi:hypothetical protein
VNEADTKIIQGDLSRIEALLEKLVEEAKRQTQVLEKLWDAASHRD